MSGLTERLNRLRRKSTETVQDPDNKQTNQIPSDHVDVQQDEWSAIGARRRHNEWGSFIVREQRYPFHYRHGHYELGQLCTETDGLPKMVSNMDASIRTDGLCFIDTETTGLGHGAGNVPFMIGIGYYEDRTYIVEQLFIRNPGEELAMLHYLSEKIARFTHIVSYNGRAFDWPIIKNRTVLNRIPFPDQHLSHIDLLYPARNLWKETLPSCRLGMVEGQRLGVARHDDIPGSLAPTMYFQYLATGDIRNIQGVFVHNELDILSLAGLSIHFTSLLTGCAKYHQLHSEELFRLGLWLGKLGDGARTEEVWDLLHRRSGNEVVRYLTPMAEWYKKTGNLVKAVQLWEMAVNNGKAGMWNSIEPLIELAMYFEHRRKDYERAIDYVAKALELVRKKLALSRGNQKYRSQYEQLRLRMDRLHKKYLRQEMKLM